MSTRWRGSSSGMKCCIAKYRHVGGRAWLVRDSRSVLPVYSGESGYSAGGYVSPAAILDLALERILGTQGLFRILALHQGRVSASVIARPALARLSIA